MEHASPETSDSRSPRELAEAILDFVMLPASRSPGDESDAGSPRRAKTFARISLGDTYPDAVRGFRKALYALKEDCFQKSLHERDIACGLQALDGIAKHYLRLHQYCNYESGTWFDQRPDENFDLRSDKDRQGMADAAEEDRIIVYRARKDRALRELVEALAAKLQVTLIRPERTR